MDLLQEGIFPRSCFCNTAKDFLSIYL
jgi:hypothetical protein